MTALLEDALAAVRSLPAEEQDGIARVLLRLLSVDGQEPALLSPEERAAISRSKQAAAAGEFASATQVRTVWAKYGL